MLLIGNLMLIHKIYYSHKMFWYPDVDPQDILFFIKYIVLSMAKKRKIQVIDSLGEMFERGDLNKNVGIFQHGYLYTFYILERLIDSFYE